MSHALTGRPIMQKQPRIKVKALRDLIHKCPCMASFPHECNQFLGCHPAHNNWQQFGKGVGVKTSDHLIASVCGNAHRMLDGHVGQDTLPKEQRLYWWIEAFIATWDYLWSNRLVRVA
jgi:hypothetical protein